MMFNKIIWSFFFAIGLLACITGCRQKRKEKKEDPVPVQTAHYRLEAPQVFGMPPALDEISGIAFRNGRPDTVYAEQDEEGRLFRLRLGEEGFTETKFGKKGDYEDIQVGNTLAYMLRSDGTLFSFPYRLAGDELKSATIEYKELLPAGEYEGMYLDEPNRKLYVLCKHCDEKIHQTNTGYVFSVEGNTLTAAGSFTLSVEALAEKAGMKKLRFEPSALAWNQQTGRWFILSSVNKLLVTTDKNWNPLEVFPLDPSLYNQPEGMAFDQAGDLYISNEKGKTAHATILKIPYRPTP